MEIQGLDEFTKALENASNNFEKEANKKLDIIASKLIAKVKLKTPVDSGLLRRSWQPKKINNLERLVFNNVKYASHVNYGHRTRGGKSFVDGVYMLEKSVKEIESELDKEFSIMIDNLFK
ncbi:MAG: HK97 gp10 family phage protein [Peptostreptococcaceae bacterium]|nr:HK97 gp10 family phage protein [Peptostreptococcaceae bacterium]